MRQVREKQAKLKKEVEEQKKIERSMVEAASLSTGFLGSKPNPPAARQTKLTTFVKGLARTSAQQRSQSGLRDSI